MNLACLSSLFCLLIYLQQNSVSAKDNFGLKWLNQIYSKASYHCGKSSKTVYWTFERFILSSNSPKFLKTHQNHHIQTSLLSPEKCFITQVVNALNLKRVQIMVTSENASAKDPMYQIRRINHFERFILSSLETTHKIREGIQAKSSVHLPQEIKDLLKQEKRIKIKVAVPKGTKRTVRPEMLDMTTMQCNIGLLCWMYPGKKEREKRQPTCCIGLTIEFLALIQSELNIDMHIYEVEDGKFGGNVNGSWNGLIEEILSGKANMAAAGLAITEARLKVVEFAHEFYIDELCIAANVDHHHLPFMNLQVFAALPWSVWISLVCPVLF